MNQVCPWCQMEIVWDPEVGPEKQCPYCENELGDYRTINVRLARPESEEGKELLDDESAAWEGGSGGEGNADYQEWAEQYYFSQEDSQVCSQCNDNMLYAGLQTVEAERFLPVVPEGMPGAFLEPPFRLKLFVCPTCFHVSYRLSDKDRKKAVERGGGR